MRGTPITVLYDGDCGFCLRSLRLLRSSDVLRNFEYLDFNRRDAVLARYPSLQEADFENAMYAVDSLGRSYRGFFAFRRLSLASPLLWPLLPFFYFPGASVLGPKVYAWIARNRKHLACRIEDRKP